MKDFVKKSSKLVENIGSTAIEGAVAVMLAEVANEVMEESGSKDLAKDKIMKVGMKLADH